MSNLIDTINFSISAAGLMLMMLGLFLAILMRVSEKQTNSFFVVFFSLLLLYITSNLLSQISFAYGNSYRLSYASLFFESLFSSVLLPVLTAYMISCWGEQPGKSRLMNVVIALWTAYFILLVLTQFTTAIYYITPDNTYHRGPLYPVLLVPPALIMLINLTALIRKRQLLSSKQFIAFILYYIFPLIAMLLQMKFYGLYLIVFGTALSSMLMFSYVLTDQSDKLLARERENARLLAETTILQMRPHFIYNTMMSIYYLCQQDAEKAQNVILDFSSYLRRNFTALAKDDLIPFSEELEHARAYLTVEQVRYDDRLKVSYDTDYIQFRLPPLTLQPIVENCVRYGIDPDAETLQINISTRCTHEGSVIRVADNGPGFTESPEASSGYDGSHMALANIRSRLEMLCGGSLEISEVPDGHGTLVTIFIPDKK